MGLLSNPKSRNRIAGVISKFGNKLCIVCYAVGFMWFLLLAYNDFNARTYFSENALLPGLVTPEFSHFDLTANYYHELKDKVTKRKQLELRRKMPVTWLMRKLNEIGLETYAQNYTFTQPFGEQTAQVDTGQNVYAILRAGKTAATEALVLSAAFKAEPYSENTLAGIALMMGLAQYFRQHTYWAKDIILLITDDDEIGIQAWLSAYHHTYNEHIYAGELASRSGSIQAAVNLEIGTEFVSRFDVRVEGLNGQLPNLDLVNTVVRLCKREGILPTLHKRGDYWKPNSIEGFTHCLKTLVLSMCQLATGCASGNHGLFYRYNIEAVTLRSIKLKGTTRALSGFIEMGRVVEGIYRSLNNLLERFHQSFFFYLLPAAERYISIGLYMPAFGVLALPVVIKALALWVSCGIAEQNKQTSQDAELNDNDKTMADTAAADELMHDATKSDKTIDDTGVKKVVKDKQMLKADDEKDMTEDANSGSFDSSAGHDAECSAAEETHSLQQLFGYIPVVLMSMLFGICAFYGASYFISVGSQLNLSTATALSLGLCALQVTAFLSPTLVHWNLKSLTVNSSSSDGTLLKSLCLVVLSVLLGATAIINISLGFFIAVLAVPVAIFIAPTNNRLLTVVQTVGLVVVSPLGAVCLISILHILLVGKCAVSSSVLWQNIESGLLQSVVQSQLFDNWTYGLVCLAYLPMWLVFWHLIWAQPATHAA